MGGLLVAFAAWALLAAPVLALTGYEEGDDLTLLQGALLQLLLWIGLAGTPLWLAARYGGLGPALGFRGTARDVPVGLALGVLCQGLVTLLAAGVDRLFDVDSGDAAREVVDRADGAGVLVLVLLVVVGAPVVEELFFRGIWLPALADRWGATVGVLGSAALFAASHLQPVQLPGLFVFGLLAGVLTQRAGRLGPAVWAHVGFNATTVAVLLALR